MADVKSDLYTVLKQKCGITPAEETTAANRLQFLARLDPVKASSWKVVMHRLKQAEFDAPWSIDLSKVMFLKNNNPRGVLVHGWRVIVKAVALNDALAHILSLVKAAPNVRVELEEVALPGGGAHRHINSSAGKGAMPTSGSRGSGPSLHLTGRG